MTKIQLNEAVLALVDRAVTASTAQEALTFAQAAGAVASLVYTLPYDGETL